MTDTDKNTYLPVSDLGDLPDGESALLCDIATRHADRALEVRVTLTAAGDEAKHGGTMVGVFTLTVPDNEDGDLDADLTSQWAAGMIRAMGDVSKDMLPKAFSTAAKDAHSHVEEFADGLIDAIATIALAACAGDVDDAKRHAAGIILNAENNGLGKIDKDQLAEAMVRITAAIDKVAAR